MQEDRTGKRRAHVGEAPGARDWIARGVEQLGAGGTRVRVGVERRDQRLRGAGP